MLLNDWSLIILYFGSLVLLFWKIKMVDYSSYQEECLRAMYNNNAGQIILPTGTGKSKIEFEYAKSKMVRDDGIHQVVVIVAPRIILCQQLINNFYNFIVGKYPNEDVKEILTFVSSGKIPSILINGKIIPSKFIGKNSTIIEEIEHDVRIAKKYNRDNIIFSTYASFDRCVEGIKRAIDDDSEVHLVADEAHYFVSSDDNKDCFEALKNNVDLFKTRFFFTATPRVREYNCSNNSGMNNTNVYGEIIYNKPPSFFYSRQVICEPRLHRVILPNYINQENFDEYSGDILFRSFWKHEFAINKYYKTNHSNKERIGGKVLVAVRGSKQLYSLIENGFCEKARNKGINVAWTMSADFIGTNYNGKDVGTDEFLTKIRNLCYKKDGSTRNNKTRLIILHFDQLTEGIDVPSMTGLIVLRCMNQYKQIQNIGRTLRSHPDDHNKYFSDRDLTWIKPYSYVVVPEILGASNIDYLIEQLVNEYDARIQVESPSEGWGIGEEEQIEYQNEDISISEFKSVSGEVLHNIEYFNQWKQKIVEELEKDHIDPNF